MATDNTDRLKAQLLTVSGRPGRDLTVRALIAFLAIYEAPASKLSTMHIAELAKIDKPAASRALDALDLRELVTRTTDPADRRRIIIGRTPAGRSLFAALNKETKQ